VPLCAWERGTRTGYGSKPREASGRSSPSLPDSRRLFLGGEPGTHRHQHGRSPTMNSSAHNPHAHRQLERLLLPMPQSTTLRLLLGLGLGPSLSMSSADPHGGASFCVERSSSWRRESLAAGRTSRIRARWSRYRCGGSWPGSRGRWILNPLECRDSRSRCVRFCSMTCTPKVTATVSLERVWLPQ
jgi:hypothetical protein